MYGCDANDYFFGAAASFISCRIDKIMFTFLGICVRGNHRLINFWKPVVNIMKAKLLTWKGRLLSIGGRITLINLMLSNLTIYNISFLKMTVEIIKEIRRIQRNFLWNGMYDKRGVCWVS